VTSFCSELFRNVSVCNDIVLMVLNGANGISSRASVVSFIQMRWTSYEVKSRLQHVVYAYFVSCFIIRLPDKPFNDQLKAAM
jgi:hypothetical protein